MADVARICAAKPLPKQPDLMDIHALHLPDVKLVRPRRFGDERGWFMETYRREAFLAAGITDDFAQDNQSFSAARGTVRGLHLQKPPHAQAKLVRVLSGRILDVAVDLRRSSPTFGQHVAVEIPDDGTSIYVPVGFAHGFCTLTENVTIAYKVSDTYAPQAEAGVLWNDPALGISWPVSDTEATLSAKDRQLPLFADLEPVFP
jgi:dTDP-4-dehydrorhamnose 3,5-epimerase